MLCFETVGEKRNRRAFEKRDSRNRFSTLLAFVHVEIQAIEAHKGCGMYVELVSTKIANKRVLQTR